jgi:porin
MLIAIVKLTVFRILRRPTPWARGADDHSVLSASLRAQSLDDHDMAYTPLSRSLSMIVLAAGLCGAGTLPVDAKTLGGAAAATPSVSLWDRETLTGDWAGVRTRLETVGITLSVQEQSEVWANLTGGLRTGTAANGLLTAALTVDLTRTLPWTSTTFFVNAFQIHGRGPSTTLIENQQLVSNIEATPSTKLYNLWMESQLFGDRLSVRLGQEGANDELMLAPSAALFLNSSLGFPDWLAQNLPSGGPNYPLATPMVRARLTLTDGLTLVGAAFNGDPAGPGPGDPQKRDRSGTAFRLRDPVLVFAEGWYAVGQEAHARVLPGIYKIGALYHAGVFEDQARDSLGRSLADPTSSGIARRYRGNYALYGLMDQMLWRVPGTNDQGLSVFGLVMAGPDARNREHMYLEGGIRWEGLIAGRSHDVFGLAVAHARTSNALRRLGAETALATGMPNNIRQHETVIEVTYLYQIAPWWSLQPDLQGVFNPGAALPSSLQIPPRKHSLAVGARTKIDF